jgi:hypothetical protein
VLAAPNTQTPKVTFGEKSLLVKNKFWAKPIEICKKGVVFISYWEVSYIAANLFDAGLLHQHDMQKQVFFLQVFFLLDIQSKLQGNPNWKEIISRTNSTNTD